jgi:CRP-like cAMP-binding protein
MQRGPSSKERGIVEYNDYALEGCPLFAGIATSDLKTLLACLDGNLKEYRKGEFIFRVGDRPRQIGVVLDGCVDLIEEDYWGNRNLLSEVRPGQILTETLTCGRIDSTFSNTSTPSDMGSAGATSLPSQTLPVAGSGLLVSIQAVKPTRLLLISYHHFFKPCKNSCAFHHSLLANLLQILANRNRQLVTKLNAVSKRTTRSKLLSFLRAESLRQGKTTFDIDLNRQQLADYLAVDRSAMSTELSHMQQAGLIIFKRNHFQLCGRFEDDASD